MTADNILEFNIHVMRAVATLYKEHPAPIILSSEQILATPISRTNPIFQKRMEVVYGTIRWLLTNSFVTGTFDGSVRFAPVFNAQLSASAYQILSANEPNAENQTLGELAISAAAHPGTQEESRVAELVVRRLGS